MLIREPQPPMIYSPIGFPMANSEGGSSHRFAGRRNMLNVLNMRSRKHFKHFQEYPAYLANRVVSGILVFGFGGGRFILRVEGLARE